jgi:hypothetical protein
MKLQLTAIALATILAVSLLVAYKSEVHTRTQLQDQLKSAQATIVASTAQESARNAALKKQLAQLQKKAATVQTPEQAIESLPSVLPIPEPITLPPPAQPNTPAPKFAQLPVVDLKPLYNDAVVCKECQAQLAATQANLRDEQAKTATVSRELTDALHAAKGGSALQRIARAAKWLLIGAAAGAAAAKLHRKISFL